MPILSFRDRDTEAFFRTGKSRQWQSLATVAARKLDMVNAAVALNDLRLPPGNQLEALSKDRKGQHSIRINDQYRVCFVWTDNGATGVEIVDYH